MLLSQPTLCGLRLVVSDDDGAPEVLGLSPRMRLRQFFEQWFLPIKLVVKVSARKATITGYRETIDWWERLTSNPPLEAIDATLLARWVQALRAATWRRSPFAIPRALSERSVRKHVANLNAMIKRAGPGERNAWLLERAPQIELDKMKQKPTPLPPIPLEDCRAIFAASDRMQTPVLPHCSAGDFWRGLAATLYYGGLRKSEALALEPGHLQQRGDGWSWFDAPGSLTKTGAALRKPVHPHAAELVARCAGPPHDGDRPRLLPWPHHPRWLCEQHEKLQRLAGIMRPHTLHAWRRTHGQQIGLAGLGAIEAAQRALRHADAATTREHYVDLDAAMLLRLPRLDGTGPARP